MSLKKMFRILLGIQCVLGIGLALLAICLFQNQAKLSKSQEVHFQSYLLADELRQSSDDLTRLARTYVATGNEEFERQYRTVLDIRNGKIPRPLNYNRIYWDLVSKEGQKPRPDGKAVSLHILMHRQGFTEAELEKLAVSQKYSDELVKTERIAMNAVKGLFEDGTGNFTIRKTPDRALALKLMNDEAYHRSKVNIMKPLDEFYGLFAERTAGDVAKYERRSRHLLWYLGGVILAIMSMFVFAFLIIQRQINAFERAEAAVRLSAQNWKDTFDAINDAVWLLSPEGRILRSNKASQSMFYLKPEELLGKYCYEVMHGTDKPHPECPMPRMRTSGRRESMELFSNGSWFLITVDSLFDSAGSLTGIVHVVSDITERKTAEEALIKLTNTKARFTAMVSHELRTPLAVIISALNVVLDGLTGQINEELRDALGIAKRNSDRLGRLINDVLDFHKIEAGKMEFNVLEHDVSEVVTEVHKSMSILSKRKGLELKAELESGLPRIKFDRDKLVQVLTNLVSNAINNTEKGSVTLTAKREDNVVHISVVDTGVGISAEDLPKIFHPFGQLNSMTNKKKGGTGLGLAISQEIILAHQGKIWAEPNKEGAGATFHFVLPIVERRKFDRG